MKNMGGFSRLSISFAVVSVFIFSIGVGQLVSDFFFFLIRVISPETANNVDKLNLVIFDNVLNYLLAIRLYIYAFLLMVFFIWLSWIFAGFANNE